jgi:hypothetical protein
MVVVVDAMIRSSSTTKIVEINLVSTFKSGVCYECVSVRKVVMCLATGQDGEWDDLAGCRALNGSESLQNFDQVRHSQQFF